MHPFLTSKMQLTLAIMFALLSFVHLNVLATSPAGSLTESDSVLARVGSETIRVSDIENKDINETRIKLYEMLSLQLKKAVIERLAEQHKEFAEKPAFQVTDQQAKSFYMNNNLESRGSYDQLYPMIKQYLEQKAEAEYIDSLYQMAEKKGYVKTFLEKPDDFKVTVPVETAYLWGNEKAPVMIIEFSDYQCPFCSRVQSTLSRLREIYKNNVVFGYRHAPLPFHREADEAAIAAECARDQGKFSPYHSTLFQNPRNLYIEDLKSYARQVDIADLEKFNECLDNEKYRPRLENDQEAAEEAGIRGTPGFVIGRYDSTRRTVTGEILSGAQPMQAFVGTIEKYLN